VNAGGPTAEKEYVDFMLEFTNSSILEHLIFPSDGIEIFRTKGKEYQDDQSDRRSLHMVLIFEQRTKIVRTTAGRGERFAMDFNLRENQELQDAEEEYRKATKADINETQRLRAEKVKEVEQQERLQARHLRGEQRRQARTSREATPF